MNQELKREIEAMRYKERAYNDNSSVNYHMMGLLLRCFLSLTLFICGIIFPQMSTKVIPQNLKDIPVYISTNPSSEVFADFIDGMAN